jgi:threonine/homoserine/homoserine lactone efflux protein
MSTSDTLLSLVTLWFVAILTPGPNMMLFTAISLSSSRAAMAAAATGIVTATAAWGCAGLFGLLWLFETFPPLALAVKLAGGAYLIFKGFQILRGSLRRRTEEGIAPPPRATPPRRAFIAGLLSGLGNPKSLVFVTSLFAVTHLAEKSLDVGLIGVAIMVAMSSTYYTVFGLMLRLTPLARGDGLPKRAIGVAVGATMMLFGARMAIER